MCHKVNFSFTSPYMSTHFKYFILPFENYGGKEIPQSFLEKLEWGHWSTEAYGDPGGRARAPPADAAPHRASVHRVVGDQGRGEEKGGTGRDAASQAACLGRWSGRGWRRARAAP